MKKRLCTSILQSSPTPSGGTLRIAWEMAKPWIHAVSSAKKFGGKPEDYIEIHNLLDSSKGTIADSRHRALTHNAWFLSTILERIFGVTLENSDGMKVSVRDIGEQHVLEDYRMRFIPSAQDYLQEMEVKEWMVAGRGEPPPSAKRLLRKKKTERTVD
jgi:hypothetical protein